MTTATLPRGVIPDSPPQITERSLDDFPADRAALTALLKAAVNVELFTVPLYMCAMKSIQGTHEINAKDIDYYRGRTWPGRSIGQIPKDGTPREVANQTAYNLLFSVFIDEMLHLQMAANLSAALGVKPDFNSQALMQDKVNWTCYGKGKTVIPHIVDLKDLALDREVFVELGGLDADQVTLFSVIEQNHKTAHGKLKESAKNKYFPEVPFDKWTAAKTETDLPLFGTIGWMYYCLLRYSTLRYTDGHTLWDKMFVRLLGATAPVGQRDLFNSTSSTGHPVAEYPLLKPTLTSINPLLAHIEAFQMVWAICDQGEGGIEWKTVKAFIDMISHAARARGVSADMLNSVLPRFQPSREALEQDYPTFTDTGAQAPWCDDATARADNGGFDHFERFGKIATLVNEVETWTQWHAAGNAWSEALLTTPSWDPAKAAANIPKPSQVADALNELKTSMPAAELDNVVKGAIAGITTVLSDSWENAKVDFPFPSMVGSGDRMALYWAVYGQAPTLNQPDAPGNAKATALHACQSLALDASGGDCAAHSVYHSCKGSNLCGTQGGCGFVQPVSGGGNCSQSVSAPGVTSAGGSGCGHPSLTAAAPDPAPAAGCGAPQLYSAPADNLCKALGGCAVPISASQLYPKSGTMKLFDHDDQGKLMPIPTPDGTSFETLTFDKGDSVYDIAWGALEKVWEHRKLPPQAKPEPTTLRIALPPST